VRAELEIVFAVPVGGLRDLDEAEVSEFAAVRSVELASIPSLAVARAAGVRKATAPLVFIGETHSFPEPGWAEALLRAHEGPWAAVVPAVSNADPRGPISWGGYLMDYARWDPERPVGEIADPMIYNTSYQRQVLLELGEQLEIALDPYSGVLWPILFERGLRAWFEPEARIRHLGVGQFGTSLREKVLIGMIVGNYRATRWSLARRLVYFFGSPLIPLVLMARLLPAVRRIRRRHRLPWGSLPMMFLGCVAKAVGETYAVAAGAPAGTQARQTEIEVHRLRYCRPFNP
jgi:hypothetical protein